MSVDLHLFRSKDARNRLAAMTESQLLPLAVLAILACAPQFGCGSERSAGGATGGLGAAGGLLGAAGGCLDPDATWSIDSFVSGIDFAP